MEQEVLVELEELEKISLQQHFSTNEIAWPALQYQKANHHLVYSLLEAVVVEVEGAEKSWALVAEALALQMESV